MSFRTKEENAITLIALIITIIILVILVAISIRNIVGDRLIEVATVGGANYAQEQKKEEEVFNNSIEYINIVTNKKPYIEKLKYSDRTESSMKITAMATDGDGETLTYKLYIGTTRDNLVKQIEIKENVEQGTDVTWTVPVTNSTSTYYYKVIVKDRYAEVDSGIRETNNAPVLGTVTLEKYLDEKEENCVAVKAVATDTENDILTYTLKMWKKIDGISEEELIAQESTIIETKKNVVAGEEIEIKINSLEEYQEYIYRVDVTDNNNITIGSTTGVKTYCTGKGIECEGRSTM